ncbi:MAG TPA: glycosyltransferase family 2 protein [Thermoanaerobaculia bacterium]|nr:glycosyltransferase family 2 protein [Thermoanaerobaculia bacterium]
MPPLQPQPLERAPGSPASRQGRRLVVLVPCLDEAPTVASVVRGVPREIPGIQRVDVVVIDDGSKDETTACAVAAGAEVLRHSTTLGLGRTFRDGVEWALRQGADIAVTIDGDGQFDPAHIPLLVKPILAGEAEMTTASRFLDRSLRPKMPLIKRLGNAWVARIVHLLSGRRFFDVSCGFRALSREALLRLNLFGGWTYTQETFLDLVFKGLRIVEIPLAVRGTREFGTSRVASNLPRYAARSLAIMLRAFVSYRPLAFFAGVSSLFALAGFGLLAFLISHYLRTDAFSPHIWAGFVGGSLMFVSVLSLLMGILGDMLVRMRLNQEQLLYLEKRRTLDEARRSVN